MSRIADIDPTEVEYCEMCEDHNRRGVIATGYLMGVPVCNRCLTLGPNHKVLPDVPTPEEEEVTPTVPVVAVRDPVYRPNPCECGCGENAAQGKRFRKGHSVRAQGVRNWNEHIKQLAALEPGKFLDVEIPEGETPEPWMNAFRSIVRMRSETMYDKWEIKRKGERWAQVSKVGTMPSFAEIMAEDDEPEAEQPKPETMRVTRSRQRTTKETITVTAQNEPSNGKFLALETRIAGELDVVRGEIVAIADQIAVLAQKPRTLPDPDERLIEFPQGGNVRVTMHANILLLDQPDRMFIIQLCKLLDHYENCQLAAVVPINKADAGEHALMMITDLTDEAEKFELANVWLGRPIAAEKPAKLEAKA